MLICQQFPAEQLSQKKSSLRSTSFEIHFGQIHLSERSHISHFSDPFSFVRQPASPI